MPDKFTQFHILFTSLAALVCAVSIAWLVLLPKIKNRGVKAALYSLSGVVAAVALFFAAACVLKATLSGKTTIDDNFVVLSGEFKYTAPFFSAAFAAMTRYIFFALLGAAALCLAVSGAIASMVCSARAKSAKEKEERLRAEAEQKEKEERERAERAKADRFSGENVRVLGNKKILRSNAAEVYREYLENKRKAENANNTTT